MVFNINLGQLQKSILNELVHKPIPLSWRQKFVSFENILNSKLLILDIILAHTHAAVLKWKKNESRMNPVTEAYIRLYIFH